MGGRRETDPPQAGLAQLSPRRATRAGTTGGSTPVACPALPVGVTAAVALKRGRGGLRTASMPRDNTPADPKSLIRIAREAVGAEHVEPLDLGERVRELRKAKGWTLEQAAGQAGLARWRRGRGHSGDSISVLHGDICHDPIERPECRAV